MKYYTQAEVATHLSPVSRKYKFKHFLKYHIADVIESCEEELHFKVLILTALMFIPKPNVNWLIGHCFVGVSDGKYDPRIKRDTLGVTHQEDEDIWWIDISKQCLKEPVNIIMETIMHEFAHAILGHGIVTTKKRRKNEEEADKLVSKWANAYPWERGYSL